MTARSRRPILGLAIVLAVALGLWAAWPSRSGKTPARSALETPYRNARPGVKYVGDAACTRCHSEIAATYRKHPMGRSLAPIAAAAPEFRGEPAPRVLFEAAGFEYSLQRTGDETIHREVRRDREGREIGRVEGPVRYILGSGTRAHAFLVQRDDYLFQSPVTWYAQKKRWDLAPGYDKNHDHFERQIGPGCLTCHANRVEHVTGTEGRYRPPIFHGHAIGCERCHGPGELHVRDPLASTRDGPSIINPRDLSPALREDVCRQCHLIGEATVARYGRELTEYRPGLPLHEFVTIFVPASAELHQHSNADHVEQMGQSRCFRESRGALGCISCHDPHVLPGPEQRVGYYRDRCLACHAERGCALSADARAARGGGDDCIGCHMPRAATSDVPHVATTLHSIPRDGKRGLALAAATPFPPADDTDLVPFHRDQMSPNVLESNGRDLGVALRHRGQRGAARALPMLTKALEQHPDDSLARESLGFVLAGLGRAQQGLAAFEAVLAREPHRESSLEAAALLAGQLSLVDQAIRGWRRAAAVDPWRSSFQGELAFELNRTGRWAEAAQAARQALGINPANHHARAALVLSLWRMGQRNEAQYQFQTLLEFEPPDRERIVQWFGSLR